MWSVGLAKLSKWKFNNVCVLDIESEFKNLLPFSSVVFLWHADKMHGVGGPSTGGGGGKGDDLMQVKVVFFQNVLWSSYFLTILWNQKSLKKAILCNILVIWGTP